MGGVRIAKQGDLAILRFDKARGNAIDEPFVDALILATVEMVADDTVRGVLLSSAHPKLFSPGLDLVSLMDYDRPGMEGFFVKFARAMFGLFALPKPLVAAVGGHAVAGGCVLALTADHRVLRRGSEMGLNEVRVGLPLPWSVAILLKAVVPPTSVARVALLGRNFKDEEAVDIGLAHEVHEAEGFEEACLARLQELAERDPRAFRITKTYLKDAALREMKSQDDVRLGDFLDAWFSAEGRAQIRAIVESLRNRDKGGAPPA